MILMEELLLFFCWMFWISAAVVHEDVRFNGCSDFEEESMYTLDGDVIWYADFKKGKGVEPQPPFIDPMSYAEVVYKTAVVNQRICRSNLRNSRIGMKDIPDENDAPTNLAMYSRNDVELGEKNILICHVSGFYPAPVNISWTKNGEKVTEGTSINVPTPNKDSTFTQSSRLEFMPKLGDIYSCSVEHPALTEPMTRIWDVELDKPQTTIGPSVFCGVGLTIGLLGVAIGTFFLIKGNERMIG